jgi:hypothetical protein
MLLRIEPRVICPGAPGDYFAEEVIATWSDDPPEDPRTLYYRALETVIGRRGGDTSPRLCAGPDCLQRPGDDKDQPRHELFSCPAWVRDRRG